MNRITWLDNLKGLLLFFVMLQHTSHCDGWGAQYFGVFHVAAFFFISGCLYSDKKYNNFLSYLKAKWSTLLMPYIVLSIMLVLVDPIYYLRQCKLPTPEIVSALSLKFSLSNHLESILSYYYYNIFDIIHGHSSFHSGPLWFVYVLFGSSLLYYIFNKCSKLLNISKWGGVAFPICLLLIAWTLYIRGIKFPLSIDVIITATFFYSSGYLFRDFILKKMPAISTHKLIIFCVSAFIIFMYGRYLNGRIDINANMLGPGKNIIGFLFGSFGGILFIASFVALLSKNGALNKAFEFFRIISRNAITILATHMFILYQLWYFCPQLSNTLNFAIEITILAILIPIFNKYFYFIIGKSPQSFTY